MFDTDGIPEKYVLKKISADVKKSLKNYPVGKEVNLTYKIHFCFIQTSSAKNTSASAQSDQPLCCLSYINCIIYIHDLKIAVRLCCRAG